MNRAPASRSVTLRLRDGELGEAAHRDDSFRGTSAWWRQRRRSRRLMWWKARTMSSRSSRDMRSSSLRSCAALSSWKRSTSSCAAGVAATRTWRRSAGSSRRTTKPCSTSRSTRPLVVDEGDAETADELRHLHLALVASSMRILACDIVTSMPRNSGTWICIEPLHGTVEGADDRARRCGVAGRCVACECSVIAGYFGIAAHIASRPNVSSADRRSCAAPVPSADVPSPRHRPRDRAPVPRASATSWRRRASLPPEPGRPLRVRAARARSSSTRSTSPAATTTSSCCPGRRLPARLDRPSGCCTRSAAVYETYNKGLSLVPTAELPWYRHHLGPGPRRAPRRRLRRARRRSWRSSSSGSARGGPLIVDRRRAASHDRLVLAPDEPGPRHPRGPGRGRHPRHRAARRQPPRLRPRRAALPGGAAGATSGPRTSSSGTSCCPATARTACWEPAARPSCGSGPTRRATRTGGAPSRARRDPASSSRWRSRASAVTALMSRASARDPGRCGGRAARRRAARPRRARRRVPRAARPVRLGPRPAARPVRLRLRLGGLRPGGQAALGLLRAADAVRRPARRPDRAADRAARRARSASSTLWWEDGFDPLADPAFVAAFADALEAHARFGGVERIVLPAECTTSRPWSGRCRRCSGAVAGSAADRRQRLTLTVSQVLQLPALSRARTRNS